MYCQFVRYRIPVPLSPKVGVHGILVQKMSIGVQTGPLLGRDRRPKGTPSGRSKGRVDSRSVMNAVVPLTHLAGRGIVQRSTEVRLGGRLADRRLGGQQAAAAGGSCRPAVASGTTEHGSTAAATAMTGGTSDVAAVYVGFHQWPPVTLAAGQEARDNQHTGEPSAGRDVRERLALSTLSDSQRQAHGRFWYSFCDCE